MAVINTKNVEDYKDKYGYVQATDKNDKITLGSTNDTIYGNLGNDIINGGAGDDRIYGDDNSSSGGNDTIKGGTGDDYIVDYVGLNYLYGEDGNDTLEGKNDSSYFDGGKGNDYIIGSNNSDTIYGGNDNDFIDGNGGNDTITGGKGINIIKVNSQSDNGTQILLKNGGGSDYIQLDGFSGSGVNKYIKSSNDLIFELKKDDKYIYLKLEDYLKYGSKYSVKGVLNAAGNNLLTWDKCTEWEEISKTFTDGIEYSTIEYLLNNNFVYIDSCGKTSGLKYSDSIVGSSDYIYGNDTIDGLVGNDTLYGGIGDDILYGRAGNNVYQFESNQGKNTIYSDKYNSSSDYTDCIKLSDYTYTTSSEQVLTFYDDNDNSLVIEYNNTQIAVKNYFKENGNTNLRYIVDSSGNELKYTDGKKFDLRDIEQIQALLKENIKEKTSITGGDGFDILTAAKSGSTLAGAKGNDKLYGGNGNDIFKIEANAGHDTIYSSKGEDIIDATSIDFISDNMIFGQIGNNLILYYGESDVYSASITFANYFKSKYDCNINYNSTNTIKLSELLNQKFLQHYTDMSIKQNLKTANYNDIIGGTNFSDKITTGLGANIINSLGGNDTIKVGNGNNNYINSGSGNNKITIGNGNNGLDSLGSRDGFEDYGIYAGDGNNTISVGQGNNYINSGSGNNKITAKNGQNQIITADGNNKITVGNGANSITTSSGNDTIKAGNGINIINAGDGNNSVIVGNEANSIITGSGNDTIKAGKGNDTITASGGNNKITVGNGANSITTSSGNDTIKAGNGNNTITSGTGDDILTLGSGNNIINISQGDGYLTVNQSSKGSDTYNLIDIDSFDNLIFEKDTSNALIISNSEDSLLKINSYFKASKLKDIQLSAGDETKSISEIAKIVINKSGIQKKQKISGTILNDSIIGGDGNDTITSSGGNDTICAGKGNDMITGGKGITVVEYFAGDGNDTITMTSGEVININYYDKNKSSQYTIEDFRTKIYVKGNDVIIKISDTDSITVKNLVNRNLAESVNFQAYYMNNHNEYIPSFYSSGQVQAVDLKSNYLFLADYSSKTDKTIKGSLLADSIIGNSEDNTIKAGNGNDYIIAGLGDDKIYGENGNNTIAFSQGDGNDTIYSGSDKSNGYNDTIVVSSDYSLFSAYDCTEYGYNVNNRIMASKDKNNLILKYSENDSITISDYFKDISKSKFDDIILNEENKTIKDNIYLLSDNMTSDDNLNINNIQMNSVIYCGSGNDTIQAGNCSNILYGGDGDDYYKFSASATDFSKLNQITDISGNDTIYLDFNHDDLYLYMDISNYVSEMPEDPEESESEIQLSSNNVEINPDLYIMSKEYYGDREKGILIKYQYDETNDAYRIENVMTKDNFYLDDININMLKQHIGGYVGAHGGSCENIILSENEEEITALQELFAEFMWTDESNIL